MSKRANSKIFHDRWNIGYRLSYIRPCYSAHCVDREAKPVIAHFSSLFVLVLLCFFFSFIYFSGIRSWDTNLIDCNLDQELKLFVSRHSARFSADVKGKLQLEDASTPDYTLEQPDDCSRTRQPNPRHASFFFSKCGKVRMSHWSITVLQIVQCVIEPKDLAHMNLQNLAILTGGNFTINMTVTFSTSYLL